MNRICVGMLLVLLDFNLTFNGMKIGLIPDFLGCYFIYQGIKELSGFSNRFERIVPYVIVLIVYSALFYALDLLGISSAISFPLDVALGLPATALSLYTTYNIVVGIKDVEISREHDLNFRRLYATWKILAAFQILTYLFLLIPALTLINFFWGVATALYFLYVFNITRRLFYENTPVV